MGQDEQGPPIRAAEQQLQGAVGHVDAPLLATVCVIDEDLSVRDIDAAVRPRRNALSTGIGKGF